MRKILILVLSTLLFSNIAIAKITMKYSGSLPVGHHLRVQKLFAEKLQKQMEKLR